MRRVYGVHKFFLPQTRPQQMLAVTLLWSGLSNLKLCTKGLKALFYKKNLPLIWEKIQKVLERASLRFRLEKKSQ